MRKALDCLLKILENPFVEKGYNDFKNYYESEKKIEEADAIAYLITKKFHANDTIIGQE
jgi:hypothetical protein